MSDYTIFISNFPQKYRAQQPPRPTFIIAPTTSQSSVSALSIHFAFPTNYYALCTVLSCAPTAPSFPSGNPALSFYIPRSDCGLYCCFPLSAPKGIPNLSDFALLCPFRKGLYLLRIAFLTDKPIQIKEYKSHNKN